MIKAILREFLNDFKTANILYSKWFISGVIIEELIMNICDFRQENVKNRVHKNFCNILILGSRAQIVVCLGN